MQAADWIGWVSSLVLVATMAKQVNKQWRTRATEGVSKWLYIGQFTAEIGFVVYSFLLENWVFLFTNGALLALNILGLALWWHHRAERA